ncbi:MAG: hemolysin family protein [Oscillospiraceae bacterium]|nr:hemolysin family protein [Oscillospiraceae bacterium]
MSYIVIILLLTASCFFSAAETSYLSSNKIRLKHMASKGNRGAERALKISESFSKTITSVLVGNTIVNLTLAAVGAMTFVNLMGDRGAAVSTAIITVLVLIFGEILPKSYAKQYPEKTAAALSGALYIVIIAMSPLVYIFTLIQNGASKLYKSSDTPSVTEDELKTIISEIEDEGVLEEEESELVKSALEFDETSIEEILVPRVKIVAVEREDSIDKILRIFQKERYSRLPVYDKSIDNIIGLLHEKDFMSMIVGGEEPRSIGGLIKKAIYVSEMKPISDVLYEMQRAKIHMAIVKDQYGGTSGIVSMEDIIEELVGEIYDENDEIVLPVVEMGKDEYEIQGDFSIGDMVERLELPEDAVLSESKTVSGWAMELFEGIPAPGDEIETALFKVSVIGVDDKRVNKIHLTVKRK